MAPGLQALRRNARSDAALIGRRFHPLGFASVTLAGLLTGASCGQPAASADISNGFAEILAAKPSLSELDWEDIRTIGVPLATKQGIWKTCYGSSQGEFRSFLYDLESVGIRSDLVKDMSSSGDYVMAHVSCDPEFATTARIAADKAKAIWNEKLRIEHLKQSGE